MTDRLTWSEKLSDRGEKEWRSSSSSGGGGVGCGWRSEAWNGSTLVGEGFVAVVVFLVEE